MKILLGMNLSPQWGPVLQDLGHDCKHWSEIGDARANDTTIMAWARLNDYIVLTHDLDFGAILAASQADAPSVIQIRVQDIFPAAQRRLVADALRRYERELLAGALIVIDPGRLRARILPLTR